MARFEFMRLRRRPFGSPLFDLTNSDYTSVYEATQKYLSTANSKIFWTFQAPEDVTITHLGFRCTKAFGSPPMYRISLRHVDESGEPETATLSLRIFTPPSDGSWNWTFQWIELESTYLARRGEVLSVVLEYYSGYVSAANCIEVWAYPGLIPGRTSFPYTTEYEGSESRKTYPPIFGFKSMERVYGVPLKGIVWTEVNYPEQIGLRFTLQRGYGQTYTLRGAIIQGRMGKTDRNFNMLLYDSDNNELNRLEWSTNYSSDGDANTTAFQLLFDDVTLEPLVFGREYFLVFEPSQTDVDFHINTLETSLSTEVQAFPGSMYFYQVYRESAVAEWTRTRTLRPMIDLVIDEWSCGG